MNLKLKSMRKSVNGGGRMIRLVLTLAVVLALWPASPAPGQAARVQPLLLEMAAQQPDQVVSVIVQKTVKNDRVEQAVGALGGTVTADLHIINAFAAELKAKDVMQLARADGVRWVSLDAPMRSSAIGDPTVRDEFGVASFNNDNGTHSWAAGWTETGDGSSSATAGYVKIANGQLQLSNTNRRLSRPANLAGAVSATLSFQYKRSGLDGASDYVALEVSANGGATWTELTRYVGPGTDSSWRTASFNLLGYAASNTTIRFATSSSLGWYDYLYVDNVQIEYAVSALPAPPPSSGDSITVDTSELLNAYNQAIKADQVWNLGQQGSSVGVAVVDSGINPNGDLFTELGVMRQVVDVRFNTDYNQNTSDGYGHGTVVSSIVGGDGSDSGGRYIGVAPLVNIVNVKVSNDDGSSRIQDVVQGLQWVLENKDQYNIRVVNLSLNSSVAESYHTNPLNAAVEILWFNKIVVVASAGNQGSGAIYPPANDPFIITVGAADDKGTSSLSDDTIATFSAYGTTGDGFKKPDLVAPGKNIVGRLVNANMGMAQAHPSNLIDNGAYFRMSGTSVAAPMVSGAVALLLQDEPDLTPDQVKYRLTATANKSWAGYSSTKAGAGYLDVYAAVRGTTTQNANTGTAVSNLLTTGPDGVLGPNVSWGSVSWGSVSWGSVSWGSVSWGSVSWGSVSWGSDYWGP